MASGVRHTGGLTNPRSWCGRCRAGYSNIAGPPLPRKRVPLTKKGSNDSQESLEMYYYNIFRLSRHFRFFLHI